MARLKEFFKRYVALFVIAAVVVPLLILLVLQYSSLAALQKTRPVAHKAMMKRYLATLADELESYYRTTADAYLSVPPGKYDKIWKDDESRAFADYFRDNPLPCARRRFFAMTEWRMNPRTGQETMYSTVYFYDPEKDQFRRETGSPNWRTAHTASGQWLYHALMNTRFAGEALEKNPVTALDMGADNRTLTKPILDAQGGISGVLGMMLDEGYLKDELLPRMIRESLPGAFDDYRDVIVTLHDEKDQIIYANAEVANPTYEAAEHLRFIFKDWQLKIMMSTGAEEQLARELFFLNLSLSLLLAALLSGGVFFALRSASRSMKLSQMKSDFVSNVSHELRTPLASIRVFGEFLKMGRVKEDRKVREYGEYIENESRRLTQLINNILDFSRIESERKTYHFQKANVADIISETLKVYDVRLRQNGFNVEFVPPKKPLPPAVVDSDAIAQAFVNLLDNAVKYSGSSTEITVRVAEKDGHVTVAVTDHGIGIPAEEQGKIFEKFYRVSTGLVHDVKGSGLGLSIVKHIVDAHHGFVAVDSEPGTGSTFTIYLPATQVMNFTERREPGAGSKDNLSLELNTQ